MGINAGFPRASILITDTSVSGSEPFNLAVYFLPFGEGHLELAGIFDDMMIGEDVPRSSMMITTRPPPGTT